MPEKSKTQFFSVQREPERLVKSVIDKGYEA